MKADDSKNAAFFSKQSMSGVTWMLGSKVFLFFVYAGISILTVRMLGKEEYGVFALCKNLVEVLVILCTLGLNTSLIRFVPELVVHKNKAGLKRLLWKTLALQAAAAIGAFALLVPFTHLFDKWFSVTFGALIALSVALSACAMLKNFYNDVLTSLFLAKRVVIFSVAQSAIWLALLLWFAARGHATPAEVLTAEIISILAVGVLAIWSLWKYVHGLKWRSPPEGIGRRRVMNLALGALGGGIGRAFMMKYTETFFLGLYFSPAVVAIYDLGFSSTMLVITFIPMALQTVFASGLSEAYVKDPNCLPRLVESLYKVMILLAVPLASFGVFFAPQAVVLFYGQEMAGAGWIASTFCFVHLLPLIAIPLSMAVGVKEKVKEFLPLLYFRVGVNLVLDWLLIPRFEIPGAIAAVVLTFVLTFPFRLKLIRSLLGGFHFPLAFFLRFFVVCPALAALVWLIFPKVNIPLLFVAAGIYFALTLAAFRFARLLRPADVAELRSLEFKKLNRLLDILAGKHS